jgi:signal-transduction protein with cAMP-binding, CBS, and nucleotidyltransferase domain
MLTNNSKIKEMKRSFSIERDLINILLDRNYTPHQVNEIIYSIKDYYLRKKEFRLREKDIEQE